jgi:sensor histidine kinase regulating citrate/malate metabolism
MTYKSKLYVLFIGISCGILLLSIGLLVIFSRKAIFQDLQSTAIAIAQTAAANINGDLIEQIKSSEDEKKPAYEQVQTYLRRARNANRNAYVNVKFIYTIYPDPKNPTKMLFGVDAEESEKDISHVGTLDPGAETDLVYENLTDPYSFRRMVKDPWGVWLTGYAPVFNSKGTYVSTIGVDISAAFVGKIENRMFFYGGFSLLFCVIFAGIGAAYLSNRASKSLANPSCHP